MDATQNVMSLFIVLLSSCGSCLNLYLCQVCKFLSVHESPTVRMCTCILTFSNVCAPRFTCASYAHMCHNHIHLCRNFYDSRIRALDLEVFQGCLALQNLWAIARCTYTMNMHSPFITFEKDTHTHTHMSIWCICIHTYTHTHTHMSIRCTRMYTYTCTHTHMSIRCECMYVCMYI